MKIMIINGPNINMLGIRETNLYGITFYHDLEKKIKIWAKENNLKVEIHQSNYEGKIIDLIQKAYFKKFNGIILNAGGYTHTSISILDALKSTNIPCIEVHLTDIEKREEYRKRSYISEYAFKVIKGLGIEGYHQALVSFKENEI
ncbi:3-dehydroquinate dehydratase [Firmicutes bacterium CAG:449]|nr:3-dehydroquinate dehydratase [Firmicutes bacterium CAG:449]